METDLILDKLNQIVHNLQTGVSVEFGEVRLIWELAYTQTQQYFELKQKNRLAVTKDDLELLDNLNELISAFFTRYPKMQTQISPTYVPTQPIRPKQDGTGWEQTGLKQTGKTTYTYDTVLEY